jgi:hypothetical protein
LWIQGLVSGANVTAFWVFRPSRQGGYTLLLAGPAHTLSIRADKTNGYRDIELLSATAIDVKTVLLRFDGSAYKPSTQK